MEEDVQARMEEFLRQFYEKELLEAASRGKSSIEVDFALLDKFSPDIADKLLNSPETVLDAARKALESIDAPDSTIKHVRFKNLPDQQNIRIRSLRSEHIGKFLCIDGIVRRASEVKPEVSLAIFECPDCGSKINVEQNDRFLKNPSQCECGRKSGFRLVDRNLFDARWIVVEEPFEIATGDRPGEVSVYLKEDLTTPEMQRKTDPGNRLKINGIVKEIRKIVKGRMRTQMDVFLEANHVEPTEIEWEEVNISKEDEEEIKRLAADPEVYKKIVSSIAPSIYGMNEVKEAIMLQIFGGVPHNLPDKTRVRGDIHVLLLGDPSVAKSQLLKLISGIIPRGKYVSGRGTTAAGLTATVLKDEEFMGGWVLEAGAMVLCHKGIIAIDEFDKMSKEDQIAMHEALEQQTISVAKASIVATLPAQVSVLAGANPKFSRFDPYRPIAEQIDIPDTLLSIDSEEPILIREGGIAKIDKIANIVDRYYKNSKHRIDEPVFISEKIEVAAFDSNYKIEWWPIKYVFRHKVDKPIFKITLDTGREIKLSRGHSIFVFENCKIKTKKSDELKIGDFVVIPKRLPRNDTDIKEINIAKELTKLQTENIFLHYVPEHVLKRLKIKNRNWLNDKKIPLNLLHKLNDDEIGSCKLKYEGGVKNAVPTLIPVNKDLIRLLGYYVAKGSMFISNSSEHLISLSFNKKETNLINDVKEITKRLFNQDVSVVKDRNSVKVNIANKIIYLFFDKILNVTKENKRIPTLVFNVSSELQKEFMKAYHAGNYCVPANKQLISDLQYLLLQNGVISSVHKTDSHRVKFPDAEFKEVMSAISQQNFHKNIKKDIERFSMLANPHSVEQFAKKIYNTNMVNRTKMEWTRRYLNKWLKRGLLEKRKNDKNIYVYLISKKGWDVLNKIARIEKLVYSDLGFCKVKKIQIVKASNSFVYDVSVPGHENFVAGLGGIACHNSRFDLKFALRDVPEKEKDEMLATHILETRLKPETAKPLISPEFLRKYVAFARKNCHPVMTREAAERLKQFYVDMRGLYAGQDTVAITLRQNEALMRMAEASAKIQLRSEVNKEDANRAIAIMKYSLHQLGYDYETGRIDIDRTEGVAASQRSKIRILMDVIDRLERELGKQIPKEDILAAAEEEGLRDVEDLLQKLKREGVLFEPKLNTIQKA